MSNFATRDEVKTFLEITSTNTDSDCLIDDLLTRTTKIMQNYMHRKIFTDTFTELHSGDGKSHILVLEHYPVSSITSIHDDLDRTFASASLLVDGTDYKLVDEDDVDGENPGTVLRLDGNVWTKGDKNIKVIYDAGYATTAIPADLVQAQVDFVSYLKENKAQRTGVNSVRLGQFAVSYKTPNANLSTTGFTSIPSTVSNILDMYRDRGIESTEGETGV